jgi:DNA-binding response OmpR family regulator
MRAVVEAAKARGKALVVEDEFLVSLHIAGLLTEAGFQVVGPAARLLDAMRLAAGTADLSLAILDVNLAGESSWPAARLLRERNVPFVFLTGYLEVHAQIPLDLAGSLVLAKPIGTDTLLAALSRLAPG